jgi:hypothetical protein
MMDEYHLRLLAKIAQLLLASTSNGLYLSAENAISTFSSEATSAAKTDCQAGVGRLP